MIDRSHQLLLAAGVIVHLGYIAESSILNLNQPETSFHARSHLAAQSKIPYSLPTSRTSARSRIASCMSAEGRCKMISCMQSQMVVSVNSPITVMLFVYTTETAFLL